MTHPNKAGSPAASYSKTGLHELNGVYPVTHPNLAQANADAIKQRRKVVRDLRHIAQLVEDGLPAPIAVHPRRTTPTGIQVRHDDLADWLLFFEEPVPTWERLDDFDGEHVELSVGDFKLTAYRSVPAEACS